jgi:hypothetical protein
MATAFSPSSSADFTSDEMQKRYAYFAIACEDFVSLENLRAPPEFTLGVDPAIIYDVFISAYEDIFRYKEWHLPPN